MIRTFKVALPFHSDPTGDFGEFLASCQADLNQRKRDFLIRRISAPTPVRVVICAKPVITITGIEDPERRPVALRAPILFQGADTVDIEGTGEVEIEVDTDPSEESVRAAWRIWQPILYPRVLYPRGPA